MSSVTAVWSTVAAVAATLGGIHIIVWTQNRRAWANLAFSITAFGVAGIAAFELALMNTASAARFGTLIRWTHLPVFVVQAGIVAFVMLYLGTGRKWLAFAAVGRRLASLTLNFLLGTGAELLRFEKGTQHLKRFPDSIDTLDPHNDFVRAIGTVPYWSSHFDGARSEKIVPSHHGVHPHPEGITEVHRILTLHAR